MKDYKQLLKELPSSTIVCAISEFDPPTVGHELLIKTAKRLAEEKNSAHVIYTHPAKNGILQEDKKAQYLSLMFPKTEFKSLEESFANTMASLKKKYKNIIVVAGSDQINGLKRGLKESVQFISITEKNPDANETKMKSFATKALYEQFKNKLPTSIRDIDGKRLMNDIRQGMGLEPIKEQLNLVKDELREQYFRGEIFNVGELVESNGEQFEIVKRGSNHLLLKDQSGELVSKWITDVKQIQEGAIQPNGTDKIDTNSPEQASNKQDKKPAGKVKGFLTFYNYDDKSKSVNEWVVKHDGVDADHPDAAVRKLFAGKKDVINHLTKYKDSAEKHAKVLNDKGFKNVRIEESSLNPNDPHGDYKEKSKVLHQLSLDKNVDQQAVTQRKLDLDKEYSKVKKEEVDLQEGDYSVTINHYVKDGEKKTQTDHEYVIKNANDRRHAKNIAMLRHEKKVGALKPGHSYGTSSQNVKELTNEEVGLQELNKPTIKRYKEFATLNAVGHASNIYDREVEGGKKPDPQMHAKLAKRKAGIDKADARLKEETEEQKKDRKEQLKRFAAQVNQDRPGISTETKPELDPFFKEELSEEQIDEVVNSITESDILDLYEEDEIVLVYEDTGEEIPVSPEEAQIDLMEVLSRQERMKAKIRFRRTQAKRERSTKIALKRYSPVGTINKRARRLAVKLMKQRLLRGRDYQQASIGEKERIDNVISKRKATIDRIAAKLVSRIRRTEKSRMSHGNVTKGDMPNVL